MADAARTAAELKPLNKKQRAYVENIVKLGLAREDAYSMAFDVPVPVDPELKKKFLKKASDLLYRPNIRLFYDTMMEEVREASTKKAVWNRDLATEKLYNLVERADTEMRNSGITMARANALMGAAKELNAIHGLNAPTKIEGIEGVVINIIEDKVPD